MLKTTNGFKMDIDFLNFNDNKCEVKMRKSAVKIGEEIENITQVHYVESSG